MKKGIQREKKKLGLNKVNVRTYCTINRASTPKTIDQADFMELVSRFVDSEGSFRVIPINEKKNFLGLD